MRGLIAMSTLLAWALGVLWFAPQTQAATCTIKGTARADVIYGTRGRDVICAGRGNDRIYGRGGNDVVYGGYGRDRIRGGAGNDTLHGGNGYDEIGGDGGDDHLIGNQGNDTLNGNAGSHDNLNGGDGTDMCLVRSETERDEDGSPACDRWGMRLLRAMREEFRRLYPQEAIDRGLPAVDGTWRHCVVSNCEVANKDYCIVSAAGLVDNCVFGNGGNGWADLAFTELRTGAECGLPTEWNMCDLPGTYGTGFWLIERTPDIWAGPGTYLLEPVA